MKPKINFYQDLRGKLYLLKDVPFLIERIFWIKATKERGNHGHKYCQQLLICLKGRFKVHKESYVKNRLVKKDIIISENKTVYIPPMTWLSYKPLTKDNLLLVLCSRFYDKDDIIKAYEEFLDEGKKGLMLL